MYFCLINYSFNDLINDSSAIIGPTNFGDWSYQFTPLRPSVRIFPNFFMIAEDYRAHYLSKKIFLKQFTVSPIQHDQAIY